LQSKDLVNYSNCLSQNDIKMAWTFKMQLHVPVNCSTKYACAEVFLLKNYMMHWLRVHGIPNLYVCRRSTWHAHSMIWMDHVSWTWYYRDQSIMYFSHLFFFPAILFFLPILLNILFITICFVQQLLYNFIIISND